MKKNEVEKWKEMNDKFINETRFRKIYDEFETKIYYDIVTNEIKRKEFCDDCGDVVCCLCFESLEIAIDTVHGQCSSCGRCSIAEAMYEGDIHPCESLVPLIGQDRTDELNKAYKKEQEENSNLPLRNALAILTDQEVRIIMSEYADFFETDEEWIGDVCHIG